MAVKKFNTDVGVKDGRLSAGNTSCAIELNNTASTMGCGCTGAAKCLLDDLTPDNRSYGSFPTAFLKDKIIVGDVKLYFNVASITKTKFWMWDIALSPLLELVIRKNFIGSALQTSNWLIGATDYTMEVPSATGWYNFTITEYYKDGYTDFCLRPNTDWNTDADNQGKNYSLNITTQEGGANQPYLLVTYYTKSDPLKRLRRMKLFGVRR